MIVLLLICSNNLVKGQIQSGKPWSSSTGEILKTDTSKVIIPISYLRDANAKLIERVYLIKINKEMDSVRKLNESYIVEQDRIIKDFQRRFVILVNDNNKLQLEVNKQKNKNKLLKGISIGAIAITVITLLIK